MQKPASNRSDLNSDLMKLVKNRATIHWSFMGKPKRACLLDRWEKAVLGMETALLIPCPFCLHDLPYFTKAARRNSRISTENQLAKALGDFAIGSEVVVRLGESVEVMETDGAGRVVDIKRSQSTISMLLD